MSMPNLTSFETIVTEEQMPKSVPETGKQHRRDRREG